MVESKLIERIDLSSNRLLIADPTLDKSIFLKHFVLRYSSQDENVLDQMVMSSGRYFGVNSEEINQYMPLYGDLHKHYTTHKTGKKEKVHVQPLDNFMGGYCE